MDGKVEKRLVAASIDAERAAQKFALALGEAGCDIGVRICNVIGDLVDAAFISAALTRTDLGAVAVAAKAEKKRESGKKEAENGGR